MPDQEDRARDHLNESHGLSGRVVEIRSTELDAANFESDKGVDRTVIVSSGSYRPSEQVKSTVGLGL